MSFERNSKKALERLRVEIWLSMPFERYWSAYDVLEQTKNIYSKMYLAIPYASEIKFLPPMGFKLGF